MPQQHTREIRGRCPDAAEWKTPRYVATNAPRTVLVKPPVRSFGTTTLWLLRASPHTRGSAGNGATPGFMTQRLWRCGGGDRKWTRMGRGRVEGVVVGSGRCRISLRDAVVMWGHTGGVVALLLNHRLQSGNPPGSGRGIPAPPARFPGCFFTPFESAPASLCPHVVRPRCHSSSLPSVV